MTTRERALEAFNTALAASEDLPQLDELRTLFRDARAHLDEPMRVAIIGHIKAGKSTLVNALLGEQLAPVGPEELTFNVNLIRHGSPGVVVHFRDGRPRQFRAREDLEGLVTRRGDSWAPIDHVEVHDPHEMLRTFELVDTPGLKSQLGADSLNTLRFLGVTPEEVESATRRASADADAVVCLFTRSIAQGDQSVVAQFQGDLLGTATPINAIGLLTKCDAYWNPREPEQDPLDEGRRVAESIADDPATSRVFYAVLPAAGQVGFGARSLSPEDIEALDALAGVSPDVLAKRLRNATSFVDREDLPVPSDDRGRLVESRLGVFGVWVATQILRDRGSETELRQQLWQRSGMQAVEELLRSHFGRRALLIKAQTSLRRSLDASFNTRERLTGAARAGASAAGGALERWETSESALTELELLRRYYRDPDALGLRNDEQRELLRVTGESGSHLAFRLGYAETTAPRKLSSAAREGIEHWRARLDSFGADDATVSTARAMVRAYERLLHHAEAARNHLELEA